MSSCFPWLERAGGEGGWDAGPRPGRQFFFLSLSFPPGSSVVTAAGKSDGVQQGGRRLEWGLSPRCPPGAGTELGPFQSPHLGLPGLSRQIPPGGVWRPEHTSPPSSFLSRSKRGNRGRWALLGGPEAS